jgi:hypothetical protein
MICKISGDLGPKDVTAFADTCQSLRYTLAEEKRSAMLIARARRVRNPVEARGVVSGIQTDISRPHLRAESLATLVRTIALMGVGWSPEAQQWRIQGWPANERTELFNSIWTAIMQVPPKDRATSLKELALSIRYLPERTSKFSTLLEETMQLPARYRADSLAELAGQIPFLETAGQQAMFSAVIEQARQLPIAHRAHALEALVAVIPDLPEPVGNFEALLAQAGQLPAPYEGSMLEALAWSIGSLQEPAARFDTLLDATTQLSAPYRGPMLRVLAWILGGLPEAAQPAAFESAIREVEQLASEQRTDPLKVFTWRIGQLAQPARAEAFDHVLRVTTQLDSQEDQARQLGELALQLPHWPEPAYTPRLNAIRYAIGQLPPDLQAKPSATLRKLTGKLFH